MQPAMFMRGLLGSWQSPVEHGMFVMPYSKNSAMTFADYRDVAEAEAIAFTTDDLVNGTFELAAGGMVTRTEIAALMTQYSRREITAQDAGRRISRRQQPGSAHHPRPPRSLDDFFAELAH